MGYVQAGIKVSGLNEAVAGLKAMGNTRELRELNLKAGNMVAVEARILVPVKTGALQGAIRASGTLKGVVVLAGRDPAIPYANAQNWGWFYDRKRQQAKNIKPTQFMNKAGAKVLPKIIDFYLPDLLKIYEKVSKSSSKQ